MAGWFLLWIIVLISLYTDLKTRKIYNKVVLPGMVLGLALNGLEGGAAGMLFSLKGLGVGLGIFFLPFLLGGIGAGDVKLLGTIGAIKGPLFVLWTGLGTGVAGGIIALIILIRRGQLVAALKRIWFSVFLFFGGAKANSFQVLDKDEYSGAFPYGMAISVGTFVATLFVYIQ
jgi:prepilin peptidase CpaA